MTKWRWDICAHGSPDSDSGCSVEGQWPCVGQKFVDGVAGRAEDGRLLVEAPASGTDFV